MASAKPLKHVGQPMTTQHSRHDPTLSAAETSGVGEAVRQLEMDDVAPLTQYLRENREFLAPWEPVRDESYFTEAGQRAEIEQALARRDMGLTVPYVIHIGDVIVGRINVKDIVRGALQSAHLGYSVARAVNGRGVATSAVAEVVRVVFGELELHRLQADTLVDNVASQRVLRRNGFTAIGFAPGYARIAGRWQDHVLHQLLNEEWAPPH
jgi:ribosomal-protein-alanine N-acetyltransferase